MLVVVIQLFPNVMNKSLASCALIIGKRQFGTYGLKMLLWTSLHFLLQNIYISLDPGCGLAGEHSPLSPPTRASSFVLTQVFSVKVSASGVGPSPQSGRENMDPPLYFPSHTHFTHFKH